ncbi:MAG TPA: hypothetical protein PKW80_00635 [Bacteroidales bacterium]|nr:hypothetical protein [Bacteroidales bacterium]
MNDFFGLIYELGGLFYIDNFSEDLFDNNLYLPVGLTLFISGLVFMAAYYYLVNHPRFNRWYHWLFYIALVGIINFLVAYFITKNNLTIIYENEGNTLPYYGQFYTFSLINFIYTLLWCTVVSFIIRWGSRNCSTTPFPN